MLQAYNQIGKSDHLSLEELADELIRISNHGKDENLKSLHFDIQNLASGEWAGISGTASKRGRQDEISLLNIIRKNEILFLNLPTEGKSVQSARLGALVLQEISVLSGMRKRNSSIKSNRPFAVHTDEFDALTDPFISFLNKSRSSEFMIHLAHQTLSDLKKMSTTFEGQIMGNINTRFIFILDIPEDAEQMSKFFGTKVLVKQTHQTEDGTISGRGGARDVQEFEIHPDLIKKLQTGQCVVNVKTLKKLLVVQIPLLTEKSVPCAIVPKYRLPLVHFQSSGQAEIGPYAELTSLIQSIKGS